MQDHEKPIAHINNEGQPLCNLDSDYLHLCEPDEFVRLPKECRCQRCEQLFGHCLNIADNKQQLLTKISRRTPDQYSWCPVTDLCKKQTETELTSLSRSLRQLEVQGLVEMQTDNHNQVLVRLSHKKHSSSDYLLDVYQVDT
jgi:hypothetical protein